MAWCRPGDKPLSESMLVSLLTHNLSVVKAIHFKLSPIHPSIHQYLHIFNQTMVNKPCPEWGGSIDVLRFGVHAALNVSSIHIGYEYISYHCPNLLFLSSRCGEHLFLDGYLLWIHQLPLSKPPVSFFQVWRASVPGRVFLQCGGAVRVVTRVHLWGNPGVSPGPAASTGGGWLCEAHTLTSPCYQTRWHVGA